MYAEQRTDCHLPCAHIEGVKNTLLAVMLVVAAASTSAQTLYTKVDLDGHKTLSDRPDTTPEPAAEAASGLQAPRTPAGTMAKGSQRAAIVNANEARRRLGQAQLKRKQGVQPLPGELAQGQGPDMVKHNYWRRQEKLRQMVEQAQRRANETSGLLLAQR